MTKRITTVGVFASLALILSYVEVLIPFNFGIPGVKLGLANLMVVTGIYFLKAKDVFVISMIRIFNDFFDRLCRDRWVHDSQQFAGLFILFSE